jgi:regulator of cell morphogenesis and NO signaling
MIPDPAAATPTVNDIIARYPATIAVFNAFGVDTCCGGAVGVEEAARRDGVDITRLIEALREAGVLP